jgi:hypothetical protein
MKVARVNGRTIAVADSYLGLGGNAAVPALGELADVDVSGISDGDVLIWDDGTDTWVPAGGATGAFLTVTGGGKGTVSSLGSLGSTETIDVSTANYFYGTLNANCTIGFTGWTAGKDSAITVELTENGTGGWTPTFTGVDWLGGTTPTHDTTLGTRTLYIFMSRDGGTTIIGGQLGAGGSSPATSIWVPVMVEDGATGLWYVSVTGDGDAVMTEVPL